MEIPLAIPPGQYRNGTVRQSRGRWYDMALVRWYQGAMRAVGGWRQRGSAAAMTGTPRKILAWQDADGDRYIVIGTNSKLYVHNEAGTQFDITPVGITAGNADATQNLGYGGGTYGSSTYGTARPDTVAYADPDTWALDNWGEYAVGCLTSDGKLYEWQLNTGAAAAAISNAPTSCTSLVVTAERFLFALGASGNYRQIKWSDQADNTTWTAAATNQAGDIVLETEGKILAGRRVRGQTIILTTRDAWSATYIGPPYVYRFQIEGTGCGLIAPNAVATYDQRAIWMGHNGFFVYDGVVRPLGCDVQDYVFGRLNDLQRAKVHAVTLSEWGEVWWLYPADGDEIDSYVAYNYREDHWATGPIARTAGTDRSAFKYPLMTGTDSKIYEHEVGSAYDATDPYAEAVLEFGAGERVMHLKYLIPDEDTLGDLAVTFYGRLWPTDSDTTYGPYTLANPTSIRVTGRQIKMRVSGTTDGWRWGVPNLEAVETGKR